jgi:DNA-binding YbaB/EbfC family protein
MKARLPKGMKGGPGNMQHMLKQAQKMQAEMAQKQAELEESEYTASAGGGMVEVTVTGKKEIVSLRIKPEIVDPEDVEMLEDMVTAAVNSALRAAQEAYDSAMGQLSSGLNIPGVF